jgi:succinate dehydrogenase / fumarate reductase, cytochrome b subunit
MRERPLSPHISVYRMTRYTLLSSIANRMTGLALCVALLILAYWLTALSQGEQAYHRAMAVLSSPLAKVVFAGLLVAFCYHLVAGLRHLVWDTGRGLERRQAMQSAWLVLLGTVVLVAIFGYLGFWAGRQ